MISIFMGYISIIINNISIVFEDRLYDTGIKIKVDPYLMSNKAPPPSGVWDRGCGHLEWASSGVVPPARSSSCCSL
jgi:hypothetical protein